MDFRPFYITLRVALLATVVTFFLYLLAASVVYKMKRGNGIIDALFTLPMILPPTVAGFFLLLTFGRNSLIGGFMHSIWISRSNRCGVRGVPLDVPHGQGSV